MSKKKEFYQVIEDSGGGMFLFFFDKNDKVILGLENIEFAETGDLNQITLDEAQYWDSHLDDAQENFDDFSNYEFGSKIAADQDGIYPDNMGRAAQKVYGIDSD